MVKNQNDKPTSSFNFSAAMAELEAITDYLEDQNSDLDEAIKKFERGSELVKLLEDYLQSAQNRVKTIKTGLDK